MTIKSFEKPIIELSNSIVFKKAKLIDNQYKIDIKDLNSAEKLEFIAKFLKMNTDVFIQEYLDDACEQMSYAESAQSFFGGWDE